MYTNVATRFCTKVITWKYSFTRPSAPSYPDHLSCKQTGYGGNAIASYPSFSSHPQAHFLLPPITLCGKRKCYGRKEEMTLGMRLAMCLSYGLSTFVFFTFRALRGYSTKKTNNPIGLWRRVKDLHMARNCWTLKIKYCGSQMYTYHIRQVPVCKKDVWDHETDIP